MGKSNLADEGVEFDPCGPDTHRLHYEKLVTDASRERGGAAGGGDEADEELPEGETHGLTLLGCCGTTCRTPWRASARGAGASATASGQLFEISSI